MEKKVFLSAFFIKRYKNTKRSEKLSCFVMRAIGLSGLQRVFIDDGEDVLVGEVFDVLDEFGGVDDFDVVGEADDEAANAVEVGDEGVKHPMGAILF